MEVIILLLPLSLLLSLLGLGAFLWCVKAGQYDDVAGSAMRILLDEEKIGDKLQNKRGAETEGDK